VIVCDIAMPGEDGYSFIRNLRVSHPHIRVVALTAFGGAEDRDRALRSGFDVYLKKPIDPVTLANELSKLK
jgi:CheY-like chemotaxis protein